MKNQELKITQEVITKITNKIVQKDTLAGITYFWARITKKQMDWLNKVYKMEKGEDMFNRTRLTIDANGMEYGIPKKPIDKYGNYLIQIVPCTTHNMEMLDKMMISNLH